MACPLRSVRNTTSDVQRSARFVRLDDDAVNREAALIREKQAGPPTWNHNGVHYDGEPELLAQYLLVLDSINFCFWPDETWEYDNLALALKKALEQDPTSFSAENLARLSGQQLAGWLGGPLPLMDERVRLLREIGEGLQENFDGSAATLVRRANKSVSTLVSSFPDCA
mmetsp:Transcript_59002/g.138890  ORF Transcript_59002/g.138890 Transcript_59002/m.138890 type:complete len:169 (-) Transcript_59002:481-987(-)